jgi:thiamine biosynthesis lipoprotein
MTAPAAGMPATRADPPGDTRVPTRDPSHRRAERVMGTVISLTAPDGGADSAAADRCFAWFQEVDRRFSPFRPDSEVSRLARSSTVAVHEGPVDAGVPATSTPAEVSPELAEVLELCEIVAVLSDGAFDIRRHRIDGVPDPTGVVKGWAVDRAAAILSEAGLERFCISAGGDVLARGGRAPGVPWRIGIAHPTVRGASALTLESDDLAVATSGSTERGEHIVDGRTGEVTREVLTLSVAGPSLGRADAYATAAFAMGRDGLRWVESLPGYAACGITPEARLIVTRGLQRYLRTT